MALNMSAILNLDGNFMAGMQRAAEATAQMQERVKGYASTAKEAFGAVGLIAGAYLTSAVESAAKAQTSTVQLQGLLKNQGIAFKNTAGDINTFTGGITKMSTYSAGDAKSALINLTEKGETYGNSLKSTTALANLAAGTQTDLTSSSTLLAQAYNGRYTQLERLGIVTKAQVKAGISYSQVLDDINKRFGGSAAAQMDTYAGQTKIIGNNMASMKTAIGTALLPALTQFMEVINKTLEPMIAFVKAHSQLSAAILVTTTALGTLVGGFAVFQKVSSILGPAVTGMTGMIEGLSLPIVGVVAAIAGLVYAYETNFMGLKTFIDGVLKNISGLFNTFTSDIKSGWSILDSITDVITKAFGPTMGNLVGDTISRIMVAFDMFKIEALSAFNSAGGVVKTFVALIKSNMPNIQSVIGTTFTAVNGIVTNVFIPVFNLIKTVISTVASFIKSAWPTIGGVITGVFTVVSTAYKSLFAPALNGIMKLFGTVVTFISSHQAIINTVLGAFGVAVAISTGKLVLSTAALILNNAQKLIAKGIDLAETGYIVALYGAEAIRNGILEGGIIKMIASNAQKVIAKGLDILQTGYVIALYVAEGIHNGIMVAGTIAQLALNVATGAFGAIMAVITSPITLVIAALALLGIAIYEIVTHWNVISAKTIEIWDNIKSTVGGAIGSIASTIVSGFNSAISFITSLPSKAIKWGSDFIEGLVKGITSSIGSIGTAVSGIASKITSVLHFSVPDEGPLVNYMSWMPDMLKGMGQGIKVNAKLITDPIKTVALGIKTNMQGGIAGTAATTSGASTGKASIVITIPKLADQIIIREDSDIDKITTMLAKKLLKTSSGMA